MAQSETFQRVEYEVPYPYINHLSMMRILGPPTIVGLLSLLSNQLLACISLGELLPS